jgi:hypothetical protein
MPAYLVEINKKVEPTKRIVRVGTPHQALRHVWKSMSTIETLTTDQLMAALDQGIPIEDVRAGAEDVPGPSTQTDTYAHKLACPAANTTPIGKGNCKCQDLDL